MKLQPIETVPRDGSKVILFKIGRAYDPVAGVYEDEEHIWWGCTGYYNEHSGFWHNGFERLVPPTHWSALTDFNWEKKNDPS